MKVVVCAGAYPSDEHPAAGAFVLEQARAVAQRHDVVVVCQDGPGAEDAIVDEERGGLRTIRLRHRSPRLTFVPGVRARPYRRGIRAALDRLGFVPDLLHAHYFYVGIWAVEAGRERGIPVVLSEHSSAFPAGSVTGGRHRTASVALRGAALVCPVSEYLAESIHAAGFDVAMRVVPNPVDAAAFGPPAPRAPGPPVVVTVANLTPLKGIEALIDAVAATDARLIVVGDGERRAALERRAAPLGDRVEFRGEVPRTEVARALAEAQLFCLPSLAETHGVAFVEALASGLPVLGTPVGGVPEIVGPGDGELVERNDLAEGLQRMLASLERYDRAAIRERAVRRFGYDAVAALWDEVYAAATSAGRAETRSTAPH
jgi:glycosyltransferase involved in cell wall biosynthesis